LEGSAFNCPFQMAFIYACEAILSHSNLLGQTAEHPGTTLFCGLRAPEGQAISDTHPSTDDSTRLRVWRQEPQPAPTHQFPLKTKYVITCTADQPKTS
jgi:hypothetical protein